MADLLSEDLRQIGGRLEPAAYEATAPIRGEFGKQIAMLRLPLGRSAPRSCDLIAGRGKTGHSRQGKRPAVALPTPRLKVIRHSCQEMVRSQGGLHSLPLVAEGCANVR